VNAVSAYKPMVVSKVFGLRWGATLMDCLHNPSIADTVPVGSKLAITSWMCLLLFCGFVAGCGASDGGGNNPPSDTKDSVVKTIQVKETEFTLKPSQITLDKPSTYVFKAENSGNTTHALEVEGQGIEEETEEIQPAQSAALKVKLEAGTYELYCPVDGHKEEGMEGKVIVKEGSGVE
jgi:uncharacterized cupredoxin-like copper-binding protein